MNELFIVNQNPESSYNDEEGKRYEYPTSIANGKRIKEYDYLLFNLSKKAARSLGDENRRITGLAQIDDISIYNQNGKEYAIASYCWYINFNPFLTFEEIGGDPRNNVSNAMSKIDNKEIPNILFGILKKYK